MHAQITLIAAYPLAREMEERERRGLCRRTCSTAKGKLALSRTALLRPCAPCAGDNSFLCRSQSEAASALKSSSSAHNIYLTTKPFQPSDLLAQERRVNYRMETFATKPRARFKTRYYLKKVFEITAPSTLTFFRWNFCDNFLLCTRSYKNQINHANMIISSRISISHKAMTAQQTV